MQTSTAIAALALVATTACSESNASTDASPDAPADVAAVDGACAESVAAYCDAHPCPAGPSAAMSGVCNGYTAEGCGYFNAVGVFGVDTGNTYVFDADGGLTGIEQYFNGDSKCVAGPTDAALSFCSCAQGCTLQDASCSGDF